MRILYATQWFEPEPILKGLYFASGLQERGHDVKVVTGFPNYPTGVFYPGYKLRLIRRERMGQISIDRVPLYPSHTRSVIGRILNYTSFAISLIVYGLFARRPDVLYVYHPPLTAALAGAVIARLRRIPFVCDIQDLWPDTLAASGLLSNRFVLSIIGAMCKWLYGRADRIVVLSPGFKRTLVERGVPVGKIEVIYNWANEAMTRPRRNGDLSTLGLHGRFNAVFAGNIGPAQGLDVLVRAAKLIEQVDPLIQVLIVGDGIDVERLRALAIELDARSVRFVPGIPQAAIADLLFAADVLVLHLRDDPLFRITIPSKTQFYLAMGKPILAAVRGDCADLIKRAQAGPVVEPGNASALANELLGLARLSKNDLAAMGARARAFYQSELSAMSGFDHTLAVLTAAAAMRKRGLILKRAVDVAVAATALVFLSPVLVCIAVVVSWSVGAPVLFRQTRPGLHGTPFRLYKFRTMIEAHSADRTLLPDGERLTRAGRVIRRLSLDELPQFFNVLRGDMSLVGPRPLLISYLDRYTPEQARRNEVKPGITGLAQVSGRNSLSWDQKFAMDVWYVQNRSFALDMRILAKTVATIIRGSGISATGHETMPEFRGKLPPAN